jgi:30S ribosomal protein S31
VELAAILEPIAGAAAAPGEVAAGAADILASLDRRTDGEIMGKGDLRTRRGKIYNGSHGKTRPGKAKKKVEGAAKAAPRTRK